MPKVPIGSFARFYEARPADQVRIVRDIRTRLMDPDGYTGRDYYHQLRSEIRKTHWSTNDISAFEGALNPFLERTREDRREHYRSISESYIDFWTARDASYFSVGSTSVEIGGLEVTVTPEVGMTFGKDSYALKIWFNAKRPTRPARQLIQYMMERAGCLSADWQDNWQMAIWDLRRKSILPSLRTARDFELGILGQAAAFIRIWDELG